MHTFVKVTPADDSAPAGKLADVELHFAGGELDGLRLIGFAVWSRRDGGGRSVTFPARQFTVHGERRHYSLLRSVEDVQAERRLRRWSFRRISPTRQEAQRARPRSCSWDRVSASRRHPDSGLVDEEESHDPF